MERLEQLVQQLARTGQSLACAESCTGGLIGARLTAVPGVSSVFRGGVIAYANSAKTSLLGVGEQLIESEGAVSAACAAAMAEGVRERLRSDWSVATTGIAGPGGATPSKPVGLVYIAVAGPAETIVDRNCFAGDRQAIREQAVARALELLHDQACASVTG